MDELKKNAWLLSLIVILVVIKFAIVPIFEWQDSQLSEVKLLTKRLNKIEQVLANENENSVLNQKLQLTLGKGEKALFNYNTESTFKLAQQKFIQSLLNKHNLKLQNIGFQAQTFIPEFKAMQFAVQVRFTGKTEEAIALVNTIEQNEERIAIDKFNLSFKGLGNKSLGRVNGMLSLFLYARTTNKETIALQGAN